MAEQIGSIFVDVSADIAAFTNALKSAKETAEKEGTAIGQAAGTAMANAISSTPLTSFPGIGGGAGGGGGGMSSSIGQAGAQAAQTYGQRFQSALGNWYTTNRDRIGGRFEKLLDPERFAKSLTEGFKTLNEGGSLGTALEAFVKNIPLVGAFYDLGKEAGTYFFNAFSDEGKAIKAIEDSIKEQEKQMEAMRQRASERQRREKEEQAKSREEMFGNEQMEREQAKWRAQVQGDEYEAALQDAELKLLELRKKLSNDLTASDSDEETRRILARFEKEKAFLTEQLQYEYDEINRKADEAAAEEQKRQDELLADEEEKRRKIAEREQEAAMRAAEKLAEEEMRAAKEREEMTARYIEAQAEAASAVLDKTTMSASTAIGEYRFSAYPAQKQAIDMMKIVTAVQTMATMLPRIGMGGIL